MPSELPPDRLHAEVATDAPDLAVEPAAHRGPHFPGFDGLRAIAALTVLMVHTTFAAGITVRDPHTWAPYVARLEIGVAVFFVISGFLLYRPFVDAALTGRARLDTGAFYKRRALRIVPAYWVCLTVLALVHVVSLGRGVTGVIYQYGFLKIYVQSAVAKGVVPAWSLCTEVTFYLFLPLYAWTVRRRRRRPREQLTCEIVGVVILVLISLIYRIVVIRALPTGEGPLMVDWLPAYLDLFAAGMFLAVVRTWAHRYGAEPALLRKRWMPWVSWGLAGLAYWAVCNIGLPTKPLYHDTIGLALPRQALYGAFAVFLLLPAVFGPQDRGLVRRFLQLRPIAYVGVVSYGIYIWHQAFITWYGQLTHHREWAEPLVPLTLFTLAGSLAVATLSYRFVELPFLGLKDRPLFHRRRLTPPTPAPAGSSGEPLPAGAAGGLKQAGRASRS